MKEALLGIIAGATLSAAFSLVMISNHISALARVVSTHGACK